jgi:hypothetical protein
MERTEKDLELIAKEQTDERNNRKQETEDLDLLPEFCQYRDEGCVLFCSCLDCPFPDCLEDQFRGCVKQARKLRDREMVRLNALENMSVKELSARFNVCKRTVRRALTSGRKKK